MKIGDLVKIKDMFTSHGIYEGEEYKIAMIIEGPNEVGKIKILLASGETTWIHSAEAEFLPKERRYLKNEL